MARRSPRGLQSVGERLSRAGIAATSGHTELPLERFVRAWAKAVAPAAARHSWPHRVTRAGVLTIACSDAGWAQELGANAESLGRALAEAVPDVPIQRLRFTVADRALHPSPEQSNSPPVPKPGRAHLALATHAVEGVADEELRSALKRAIAAALVLRERANQPGDPGPR